MLLAMLKPMLEIFTSSHHTPYFNVVKTAAGCPPSQKTLRQIDVWSIHRSLKVHEWMKANHPTILDFVLGGCTGVAQPCDVGTHHMFKLAARKVYHKDIVNKLLALVDSGKEALIIDISWESSVIAVCAGCGMAGKL
jgi:hypothetical protein